MRDPDTGQSKGYGFITVNEVPEGLPHHGTPKYWQHPGCWAKQLWGPYIPPCPLRCSAPTTHVEPRVPICRPRSCGLP